MLLQLFLLALVVSGCCAAATDDDDACGTCDSLGYLCVAPNTALVDNCNRTLQPGACPVPSCEQFCRTTAGVAHTGHCNDATHLCDCEAPPAGEGCAPVNCTKFKAAGLVCLPSGTPDCKGVAWPAETCAAELGGTCAQQCASGVGVCGAHGLRCECQAASQAHAPAVLVATPVAQQQQQAPQQAPATVAPTGKERRPRYRHKEATPTASTTTSSSTATTSSSSSGDVQEQHVPVPSAPRPCLGGHCIHNRAKSPSVTPQGETVSAAPLVAAEEPVVVPVPSAVNVDAPVPGAARPPHRGRNSNARLADNTTTSTVGVSNATRAASVKSASTHGSSMHAQVAEVVAPTITELNADGTLTVSTPVLWGNFLAPSIFVGLIVVFAVITVLVRRNRPNERETTISALKLHAIV